MSTLPPPIAEISALQVALTATGRHVVNNVSFSIRPGEILGVVGESGSGKTTVGMTLLGYVRDGARIVNGSARVGDAELVGASEATLRELRGHRVSYVSQDPSAAFNPALRIRRQLLQFMRAHQEQASTAQHQQRIDEVLTEVALPVEREFQNRYPHQLSGGQLQRVAIALALLLKPPVIVLDEPTTGLDVTSQETILRLVRELCTKHQIAAMYVTHDLAVVSEIADQVVVMRGGEVVEHGATRDIFCAPTHAYTRELIAAAPDLAAGGPRAALRPAAAAEKLLEVRGLRARYGSRTVIPRVDFDLYRGECLALVGESGSGKSTLSKCLIGLHAAFDGTITFRGSTLQRSAHKRHTQARRELQYIFQSPHTSLNPRRTAMESIAMVHAAVGGSRRTRKREVLEALLRVGLDERHASALPAQLSGGERQRVSIARALVANPDVLICDEITSALDVIVQAQILELLKQLQQEQQLSLIFVTHNLAVVGELATRTLVMRRGVIVEEGATEQVFSRPQHEYTKQLVGNTLSIQATREQRWG